MVRKNVIAFVLCLSLLLPAVSSNAEETYRFERMWPTLHQPWYFTEPVALAIDKNDNLYVANKSIKQIQKFTSGGHFITKWNLENRPNDITVDSDAYIYVLHQNGFVKFTQDGKVVMRWVGTVCGDGQLPEFSGIAADRHGNIYVSDAKNHCIQKITSYGNFVEKWGIEGSGDGELKNPSAIHADDKGNIYVTDAGNFRIQKFSSEGMFVAKWEQWHDPEGKTHEKFLYPTDISADEKGNICIINIDDSSASNPCYILKFSPDGQFLSGQIVWGAGWSIAVNSMGHIYVTDMLNYFHAIHVYSPDGEHITDFYSYGSDDGEFQAPRDIALDSDGRIYVSDVGNNRIQKFGSDGRFLQKWDFGQMDKNLYQKILDIWKQLSGYYSDPEDSNPDLSQISMNVILELQRANMNVLSGLTVDRNGDIFVCDTVQGCIHKINASDNTIERCIISRNFFFPHRIKVDASGNFYVADYGMLKIYQFDQSGKLIADWGGSGDADGRFGQIGDLAIDSLGHIYVVDRGNNRFQKFSPDGQFIMKWGKRGDGTGGEFSGPSGIAIDGDNNIFIVDSGNDRIQKFDSEGNFITMWGENGNSPGQMNYPESVTTDANGTVYVVDMWNHRIQSFRKVTKKSNNRAIVVAGAGKGDSLWDSVQMNANFAYRTLTYQGFTKENIFYLSDDTELDLDNNGKPDDVDGKSNLVNLEYAIKQWGPENDTEHLLIYLIDHGGIDPAGKGTFRMNLPQYSDTGQILCPAEILKADTLNEWLSCFRNSDSKSITIIYDACKSGSFLSEISGPGRVFITSTNPEQNAYFITQGSISFSNFFWTHIFNGSSLEKSFDLSYHTIKEFQTPLLDGNGDGHGNEESDFNEVHDMFIGSKTVFHGEAPVITEFSPDISIKDTSTAEIYAKIQDDDAVTRVWAVIRRPDYHQSTSGNPVLEIPEMEMNFNREKERYEAVYTAFNIPGNYKITYMPEMKNSTPPSRNRLRLLWKIPIAAWQFLREEKQKMENWPLLWKRI
ncbi:MAG: 6-bladed beta-propeller [Desulfococcaceae bacterium]